jgi:type VI secretion system protein ImpA
MPLRDDLLDPIPGNNPSGANLYYSSLFDEIKEARRQEDAGPMGLWEHERKTADYKQVIRLAEGALATKTKDLQLAAWLTEALIWRNQFAGLREGLDLIRGLIEKFWDTLYPELEDNDAEFRAAPVEWLGNYFEPEKGSSPALAVRNVPLTSSGLNWYQYKESRAVGYERDIEGNEARSKAREEALAEGKLAPEQFDAALGETPKAFYRTLEADRAGSVESLQALNELCQVKFGDAAPSMGKLRQALEEVGSTFCRRSWSRIPILCRSQRLSRSRPQPCRRTRRQACRL